MKEPATVVLERCSYEQSSLADVLERISPFLDLPGNLQGQHILLKPNLISHYAPSLACTDRRFIVAVARWFVERGASVRVGDSPAFGTATGVLRYIDALADLNRLGAKVVEFSTPRLHSLSSGVRVGIAAEALDCDLMVNLPKVKAHNQMYMTMAVKNIFGIVKGVQKSMLHMRYGGSHQRFAEIILDLQAFLPRQVTLADGIVAMHIAGPMHGRALSLHCIAASADPLAVDTALLAALELSPEKSPLWTEAKRRGYTGLYESDIQFPFLVPDDFHGSGFMAPESLAAVRFNPFRFLYGHFKRIVLAIRL